MSFRSTFLVTGALLAAACAHKPPPTPQASIDAASADARKELRTLVGDADRAAKADAIVVQLQSLLAKSTADAATTSRALQALDRDRDATAEQFQALQAAADATRLADLQQAVTQRASLATLLTAEEWKKSADARRKLLDLGIAAQP